MKTDTQKNWIKHFDKLERQNNTKEYYSKKIHRFRIHPLAVVLLLVGVYSLLYYSKHSDSVNERIEAGNVVLSSANGMTLADSLDTVSDIIDDLQDTVDPKEFDNYIDKVNSLKMDQSYDEYRNAVTTFIEDVKYDRLGALEYNAALINIFDILELAFENNNIRYERESDLSISYRYFEY